MGVGAGAVAGFGEGVVATGLEAGAEDGAVAEGEALTKYVGKSEYA
jgi:hypothetical protein